LLPNSKTPDASETRGSVGKEIIAAIDEIQAYKRGELELRVTEVTARPNPYAPAAIRARFGLSQAEFADLLNIHVRTLQQWEQGRRHPTGPALTLLRVVAEHPDAFGLEEQPS
jgi:putative transcriptional regulator